jgi:hypothetical protein
MAQFLVVWPITRYDKHASTSIRQALETDSYPVAKPAHRHRSGASYGTSFSRHRRRAIASLFRLCVKRVCLASPRSRSVIHNFAGIVLDRMAISHRTTFVGTRQTIGLTHQEPTPGACARPPCYGFRVGGVSGGVGQFLAVGPYRTIMNYMTIILVCAIPACLLFVLVVVPRIRMERRARALLAQYPGAERTSVYFPMHSTFSCRKRREIDAKIAEMQPQGWIYLRAVEASPFRTIRSWGGGLTLHFIRTKD